MDYVAELFRVFRLRPADLAKMSDHQIQILISAL